jgi:hypothetical protein
MPWIKPRITEIKGNKMIIGYISVLFFKALTIHPFKSSSGWPGGQAVRVSLVKLPLLYWESVGTWGTGLTNWTYYDMDTEVILQRGETCHDKPDWMHRAPCIIYLSVELSAKR